MERGRQNANGYVTVGPRKIADDPQAYACTVLTLPATFSLVYESADGRLCVFEDAAGHVTAVDATRLV